MRSGVNLFLIITFLVLSVIIIPVGGVTFTYTLSGGLSSSRYLVVDDDITIYVNGRAVFVDNDKTCTDCFWANYHGKPIVFQASPGDTIRIVATNPGGGYIELSPLYLHASGQSMKLTNGVPRQSSNTYTFLISLSRL